MAEQKKVEYFTIHIFQIISGLIFLSIGILSLIYYDYGLLSFLFALPQFFLTGLIPLLIGILIIFRGFFEAEKVKIISNQDKLQIEVKRKINIVKFETIEIDKSSLKYTALRYRETKAKRWIIIFILVLFTIEVDFQNAVDLYGNARIAPMLVLWTIMSFAGIIIFTFTPRRFLEIANHEETLFIPYKNLSKQKLSTLLEILNINSSILRTEKVTKRIIHNLKVQFTDLLLGVYLLFLGILLMMTPTIYLGAFTRTIVIVYAMKLILRIINGDPYFTKSMDNENLFFGDSPRLTFVNASSKARRTTSKTYKISRFHPFEIVCIVYLVYQAILYGLRHLWWKYAEFSITYFTISIILFCLLIFRWFKPIVLTIIDYDNFKLNIRESESLSIGEQFKQRITNFKKLKTDRSLQVSLILFIIFLIWPVLYIIYGGNFLLI